MPIPCPTEEFPDGRICRARLPDLTCDFSDGVDGCDQPIEPGDHYFEPGIVSDEPSDSNNGKGWKGYDKGTKGYRFCLGAGHPGVPSAEEAAKAVAAAPPRVAWNRGRSMQRLIDGETFTGADGEPIDPARVTENKRKVEDDE